MQFKIRHQSEQDEAGGRRKVEAELSGLAFEAQARLIAQARLNAQVAVKGFLAARSKRSKRLILHVKHIEFIEGA